jgi:hypothetical protein
MVTAPDCDCLAREIASTAITPSQSLAAPCPLHLSPGNSEKGYGLISRQPSGSALPLGMRTGERTLTMLSLLLTLSRYGYHLKFREQSESQPCFG